MERSPVTAVATDTLGASTTSASVAVTVTSPNANRINVAAAANGGSATASSTYSGNYPASAAINGDRTGAGWTTGNAGWADGTPGSFPDSLSVQFNGAKTVDEVDVFSLQDNYQSPVIPSPSLTFSTYGVRDFHVDYWDGAAWRAIPGATVTGNNLVWRQLSFAPVTTTAIRLVITGSPDGWSRVIELEAYGQ